VPNENQGNTNIFCARLVQIQQICHAKVWHQTTNGGYAGEYGVNMDIEAYTKLAVCSGGFIKKMLP
jgi:hypothetical protein